ncbi:MAG: DUF4956 domain-containing protein [Lachnospiraceae bacterium]|nr:DUF4956 domain-containing protein [Lachnospiraceae bacterium]
MSIKDVIKDSVYSGFTGGTEWNYIEMLIVFFVACIIGVYIYYVYKVVCKTIFYSKDMHVTIAGLVVLVAAIMLAMQSNIIVSLGMVGALSIVRFRNAVKNPTDLLFLFWSVSAGIICGVGLHLLAMALCLVMTVMILFLNKLPQTTPNSIIVLQDRKENTDWKSIKEFIDKNSKFMKEKSRNVIGKETEIILEVKPYDEEKLVRELEKKFALDSIKYLSYDGEYRG